MGISETVTILALATIVLALLVLNRYFKARSIVTRMNLVVIREIRDLSLEGEHGTPAHLRTMCEEHDAALSLLAHGKYNQVVKDYSYVLTDERWEH